MKQAAPPAAAEASPGSARVDLWLWATRLYKTRSLAGEACRKGQVTVNGQRAKPARQVRSGDEVAVEQGPLIRTLAVRATLSRRVAARLVEDYLEDRTPEEARAAAAEARRQLREGAIAREEGAGRPTKKERRDLEQLASEAGDREDFFREVARSLGKTSLAILLAGACWLAPGAWAEDPPRRSFEPSASALTFKIAENLSVSAEKLEPETDPATGALTGLVASGNVLIQARPKDAGQSILVACARASYRADGDVIVLTGWPAVKSGMQTLRATSPKTRVQVTRSTGKWEIQGPHRIELNFGR